MRKTHIEPTSIEFVSLDELLDMAGFPEDSEEECEREYFKEYCGVTWGDSDHVLVNRDWFLRRCEGYPKLEKIVESLDETIFIDFSS